MGRTDQTVKPDRTETTEQPVNREHRDQMVLPVLPAKTEMREQPVNVENPPVSYTHLDVYKRQIRIRRRRAS